MNDLDNVIGAFTAEQVVRMTGLTMTQLAYWDRTQFFEPQYAAERRRSPYSRIYSFKDVVGLRTISVLRNGHQVSMPHLREVARKLSRYSKTPWADIKLMVWKREVQWYEPDTGKPQGVIDGQYVMLPIIEVIADVKREADKLRTRSEESIGKVEQHRFVAHNRPVVSGTRVPVEAIKRFAEAGYSTEAIIREFPVLKPQDVKAALKFEVKRRAA